MSDSNYEKQNRQFRSSLKVLLRRDKSTFTDSDRRYMENLIQAFFINSLNYKICERFKIDEEAFQQKLCRTLGEALWNSVFTRFREAFLQDPELSYTMCSAINSCCFEHEFSPKHLESRLLVILRMAIPDIEGKNFINWVVDQREISTAILCELFTRKIVSTEIKSKFRELLTNDDTGHIRRIFERYLYKNKYRRLADLIYSGELNIEKKVLAS